MNTVPTKTVETIFDKIQRISGFFSRQDSFVDVLVVWLPDGRIISQVLPGANATLAVLRGAIARRRSATSVDRGRTRPGAMPAHLARLDTQIRACVRALSRSGVEFVFAWRIAGREPELAFHAGPQRQDPVRDVNVVLEHVARSQRDLESRVPGELPKSQW